MIEVFWPLIKPNSLIWRPVHFTTFVLFVLKLCDFMPLSPVWIDRLSALKEILLPELIPQEVIQSAIKANPWFSEADIKRSVAGISLWLEEEVLIEFLNRYEQPTGESLRVGVIAAGNLPLVCMHDVLSVLVSGQQLFLKPSSQDGVIIRWILNRWIAKRPELAKTFHLVERLPEVNLLIATGSNNTARHLASIYGEIPHLMRKNRFSIALLGPWTTAENVTDLMEDVFSYNGLGCRNVSNVVFLPGFSKTLWEESLRAFPRNQLHPLYLERYLIECVRRKMTRESYSDAGIILRIPSEDLRYASMGVLYELDLPDLTSWESLARRYEDEIQCVVGHNVPYGSAQYPTISDFADGVDTVAWVLDCQNRLFSGLESIDN